MQTFLPYADFRASAKVLDYRRLGKQRVEAYQILRTLFGEQEGWKNHPVVKMWKGYEFLLSYYGFVICDEWISRGYKDTLQTRFSDYGRFSLMPSLPEFPPDRPHWLGEHAFHDSHKSNLLRKDPIFYGRYGWEVSDNLPYVWG